MFEFLVAVAGICAFCAVGGFVADVLVPRIPTLDRALEKLYRKLPMSGKDYK